jgi:glycosyltransferase involved in cell wall biosynthesis
VLRATDRLSTVTTTNSHAAAKRLVERRIVPSHRVIVIPNGIDLGPFRRAEAERSMLRRELGIPDAQFVWLAAGRLEPQKDYATLLAALARCSASPSEHCLLIAGQGQQQSELERAAVELGVSARVRFLGLRDDVPQLVAACDALVLASRFEGLPNVVMEAMAGARPVVATRVGGTAELVEHGVTGLLVDPGDAGALAQAMCQVMAAPESSRHAMGTAGRSVIAERYSLAAMDDQWLGLLDRCLAAAGDARCGFRPPLSTAVPGAVT